MPFSKGDTPDRLKNKGIPQSFIDQFIEVFNSVLDKTGNEGEAYQQAYGVMTKALLKAGYRQGRDKKWHKQSKKESAEPEYVPVSIQRRIFIEEQNREKALSEGLRFTGVALVDHAISQQGTGYERYFSPQFNDLCLAKTKEYMEQGHLVTIYNSHGSALGSMFAAGPEKNPIGKMEEIWRDGEDVLYRGFISATDEGQDVIRLMLDGIRNETSVRIYDVDATEQKLESESETEEMLVVMQQGFIGGIDFCDEAGIPGAGLMQILESAPRFQTQEDTMLTLDELKAEHPDLVDAIVGERLGVLSDLVTSIQEEKKRLEEQIAATPDPAPIIEEKDKEIAERDAKIAELREVLAQTAYRLDLYQRTSGPLQQEIYSRLLEEKPENLDERIVQLRDEVLTRLQAEYLPRKDSAEGVASFTDQDKEEPTEVPEDMFEGQSMGDILTTIAVRSAKGK